ncbi:TetR/AcrR family transcriptional regulator [Microbacterium telephonicum]|uniref:TetR family transcriptional regulator n=1 Tax=Microbacterium telephonicum TaxID=1714841 RepID=A0A498CBN3_9MICO|nr:TetR/AcrR family transcriptional regulator [Microbacterium telephonicum]RLK52617.1 TetR family transcriptional regulator [Microbacterium telephonicum]
MTAADPDAPRSRGAYAKGIARRQEILDRAIEVFAQRGSERTSLRAIAREVGVTHAALTHYFGSLEELLVEVYRESEADADSHVAPPVEVTPGEAMRISAEENRAIPGLVQLYSRLVAASLEEGHLAAHTFVTERFARLRASMADGVRRHQDAGRIRADVDPELVAALVIAASDGLQTQWLLDGAVDHEAALSMLDRLLAPPA